MKRLAILILLITLSSWALAFGRSERREIPIPIRPMPIVFTPMMVIGEPRPEPVIDVEPAPEGIFNGKFVNPAFVPSSSGDCPTTGPAFTIEGFATSYPRIGGGTGVNGGCKSGQTIITVTSLADSGAGTLRDAIENHTGARLIKFAVSGDIILQSELKIAGDASNTKGDVTIDGQDAPNGGICIRSSGTSINPSGLASTFTVTAENVIIRYIRFRQGPPRVGQGAFQVICDSGFCGKGIVLDHVSVSWGTDGNADFSTGATYGTYQWCYFTEMSASGNILIRYRNASQLTIHHSLFAQAVSDRNCGGYTGQVDCVNNVIYRNFNSGISPPKFDGVVGLSGDGAAEESTDTQAVQYNYVKNYFKAGDAEIGGVTNNSHPIYLHGFADTDAASGIWLDQNTVPAGVTSITTQAGGSTFPIAGSRFSFPAVTTTSAAQAFTDVLAGAGASLPCRDAVDTRITTYVNNGTGAMATNAADDPATNLGGWPDLTQPCAGGTFYIGRFGSSSQRSGSSNRAGSSGRTGSARTGIQ